jgi:hypothetical protein
MLPVELQLIKIARDVRWRSELWNNEHRVFDADLCGMCALAAAELHDMLSAVGFKPQIAVSVQEFESHCFILCDGYIVDVTATQFYPTKDQRIVVVDQYKQHSLIHYNNITHTFDSVVELKEYQRKAGWSDTQICK